MVDIFGGSGSSKATKGPRGPPGAPGTIRDLCKWMPLGTVRTLRNYEEKGCFLLGLSSDITRQESGQAILSWNSRSQLGKHLKAIHPASEITTLPNGQKAIEFTGKECYHAPLRPIECIPGSGFLAITFLTDSDAIQTLVGRHRKKDFLMQNFEINVTTTEIFVCGYLKKKPIQIPIMHNCRKWTTFFLQYTITPQKDIHFEYMINADINQKGQFSLNAARGTMPGMTLASRENGSQHFSGKIHALEIYFTENSKERIPDEISLLVSRDQKIKHDGIVPRDQDLGIYTHM